jgi:peptidoglycan/LPS O-acetylase OafA/YrhL
MRQRQPGLDLLRAMAIVFVVVYHAGLFGFELPFRIQRFGWIGVDLFFVLSGYLIGGQLF